MSNEQMKNNKIVERDYDEDYLLQNFGERLSIIRKEKGETQLSLAFKCGTSKSYISELETGKRNPTVKILYRISKTLGVTLSELLDEIDNF